MRRLQLVLAAALAAGAVFGAGGADAVASEEHAASASSKPATCGPGGIEVTIALAYDVNTLGVIAATYVDLAFGAPLSLPRAAERLRPRLKSLLPPAQHVGPPMLSDGRVRVALKTAEQGIQPAKAFTLRFDCAAGAKVQATSLSCATTQVVGASGQPMDDVLAREVRCLVVELVPAGR